MEAYGDVEVQFQTFSHLNNGWRGVVYAAAAVPPGEEREVPVG